MPKVTDLPDVDVLTDDDIFPVVDAEGRVGSRGKKAPAYQIKNYIRQDADTRYADKAATEESLANKANKYEGTAFDYIPKLYHQAVLTNTNVADLTAYLQAYIDAVGVGGGDVILPGVGPYLISAPLVFKPIGVDLADGIAGQLQYGDLRRVNIKAAGAVIKATAAMDRMIHYTYDSSDNDTPFFASSIEGVRLDGNNLATEGIFSDWCIHLRIEKCQIFNVTRGIDIIGRGGTHIFRNAIRAANCIAIGRAPDGGGGDCVIRDNDLYPTALGVYLGAWSGNTRAIDNTLTREGTGTIWGVQIDGSAVTGKGVRDVIVVGNEFCGMDEGIHAAKASGSRNIARITVRDNHTNRFGDYNSAILVNFSGIDDAVIDGNFINWVEVETPFDATGTAISLSDCRRVTVSDSRAANTTTGFITMTACSHCIVKDNVGVDIGKLGTTYAFASIFGAGAYNEIRGNHVTQTSSSYAQRGVYENDGATGPNRAYNNTFENMSNPQRKNATSGSDFRVIVQGTAAPTSGQNQAGNRIEYPSPIAGGKLGLVCVADGWPGTWKEFGAISA